MTKRRCQCTHGRYSCSNFSNPRVITPPKNPSAHSQRDERHCAECWRKCKGDCTPVVDLAAPTVNAIANASSAAKPMRPPTPRKTPRSQSLGPSAPAPRPLGSLAPRPPAYLLQPRGPAPPRSQPPGPAVSRNKPQAARRSPHAAPVQSLRALSSGPYRPVTAGCIDRLNIANACHPPESASEAGSVFHPVGATPAAVPDQPPIDPANGDPDNAATDFLDLVTIDGDKDRRETADRPPPARGNTSPFMSSLWLETALSPPASPHIDAQHSGNEHRWTCPSPSGIDSFTAWLLSEHCGIGSESPTKKMRANHSDA